MEMRTGILIAVLGLLFALSQYLVNQRLKTLECQVLQANCDWEKMKRQEGLVP